MKGYDFSNIASLVVEETCEIKSGQIIYIRGPIECYEFLRALAIECHRKGARVDRIEAIDCLYRYDLYKYGRVESFKTYPKVYFSTFDSIDWFIEVQPHYFMPELTAEIQEKIQIDNSVTKGWDGWFGHLSSHGGKFLYINVPTNALAKRLKTEIKTFDFLYKALEIPPSELLRIADQYLNRLINKEKFELIDNEYGNKLSLEVSGKKWIKSCGNYDPDKSLFALPGGEVYIVPNEDRTNGELQINDFRVRQEHIKNLTIKIKNGKIISAEAERGGETLLSDIKNLKNFNIIGEFGIGFNPFIILCGSYATDEKVPGTCHFGLGRNVQLGGTIKCQQHTDLVKDLKNCELYADEELIIKNAKLV